MAARAESPVLAAALERPTRRAIVWAGAILVGGPVLAAVLVDHGHTIANAIAWGAGLQALAIVATPGTGPRSRRWLIGLLYAALSWLFVFVLLKTFRTSDTCDNVLSVGTPDNALIIVSGAAALTAVVVVIGIAAVARLPHVGVLALVSAAFVLALVVVPTIDNPRLVDTWQTLGAHYLTNDSYSTVCGREVNLET
jgi:hypothetical protein